MCVCVRVRFACVFVCVHVSARTCVCVSVYTLSALMLEMIYDNDMTHGSQTTSDHSISGRERDS